MNKRALAMERAAAHGRVRKLKNAYTPGPPKTDEEMDALQRELIAIAQRNLARRRRPR